MQIPVHVYTQSVYSISYTQSHKLNVDLHINHKLTHMTTSSSFAQKINMKTIQSFTKSVKICYGWHSSKITEEELNQDTNSTLHTYIQMVRDILNSELL